MEEQVQKTKAGLGLGIAGLVVGIVAIPVSFISCFVWYPIAFAVVALILSIIGMVMASQNNGKKGLIIAALIISIFATGLSTFWYFTVTKPAIEALTEGLENFDENWQDAMKDLESEMEKLNEQQDTTATE
jgi:phosphotransferase system  glucose/maltose/N-acetylglucosamine-specific IIC component